MNIALPAQFRHVRLEAGNISLDAGSISLAAAQNFEHRVLGHRVCLPVFDDMAALTSLARPRDLPVADSTSRPRAPESFLRAWGQLPPALLPGRSLCAYSQHDLLGLLSDYHSLAISATYSQLTR
jgi:hypothetical protein